MVTGIVQEFQFGMNWSARRVALVGATGAGKSTIAAVLFRFVDLSAGTALLNGRDLAGYRSDDVRAVISGCAADPHIFDTTIRDNLRLARPQASDAELAAAAGQARLLDWITGLPLGWDTPVGAALSGGQRQRLALAGSPTSTSMPIMAMASRRCSGTTRGFSPSACTSTRTRCSPVPGGRMRPAARMRTGRRSTSRCRPAPGTPAGCEPSTRWCRRSCGRSGRSCWSASTAATRTGTTHWPTCTDYEAGHDPADPVDRAIMATRKAVFPQHGLLP